LAQIARDALLELRSAPLNLRAPEVPIAVAHRLELAAIDGNARFREQIHLAAKLDEARAHLADGTAIVFPENPATRSWQDLRQGLHRPVVLDHAGRNVDVDPPSDTGWFADFVERHGDHVRLVRPDVTDAQAADSSLRSTLKAVWV
jgi:hypothetical protein